MMDTMTESVGGFVGLWRFAYLCSPKNQLLRKWIQVIRSKAYLNALCG